MPRTGEPRTYTGAIGEHYDLFVSDSETTPITYPELEFIGSINREPQNVIFDCINNKLWVVKTGGSESKANDCLSIDGKRFCELIGTDPNGGLVELISRGINVDMRNWPKSYSQADRQRVILKLKESANKLVLEREGVFATPEDTTLASFLETAGVNPETAAKINEAKNSYEKRLAKATGGFLDAMEFLNEHVPNKILAAGILGVLELPGLVTGWAPADILTGLSGLRDISGGRVLSEQQSSRKLLGGLEVSDRNWAYLRGALKILGALFPYFPTFYVEPVLKAVMPIPELDHKPKK